MAYTKPDEGDTILHTHITQLTNALDGTANAGEAIRATEVDDATHYAVDVRNKNATGLHFRLRNTAGEDMLKAALSTLHVYKNIVVAANITFDGVDVGAHTHNGSNSQALAADSVNATMIGAGTVTATLIAAGAVGTSEMAADSVNATIVGNRVPQFYRREGGSATDWSTAGTTTQTPGAVRMQGGSIEWTGSAAATGQQIVTYPVSFANKPLVFATAQCHTDGSCYFMVNIHAISVSQAELIWKAPDGSTFTAVTIYWFAVGTE